MWISAANKICIYTQRRRDLHWLLLCSLVRTHWMFHWLQRPPRDQAHLSLRAAWNGISTALTPLVAVPLSDTAGKPINAVWRQCTPRKSLSLWDPCPPDRAGIHSAKYGVCFFLIIQGHFHFHMHFLSLISMPVDFLGSLFSC